MQVEDEDEKGGADHDQGRQRWHGFGPLDRCTGHGAETGERRHGRAGEQDVMEVSDDEISVVNENVDRSGRHKDPR